jgi:hypothetical protein
MNKDQMFKMVYAVVAGRGAFPFDMLRYDRCTPLRGEDAALLEREDGSRAVVVIRYAGQAGEWTDARWSSFGWGLRRFGNDPFRATQWASELNQSFQIGTKSGEEVARG